MRPILAIVADALCIAVFVIIGLHTHHAGLGATEVVRTMWPFVVGLLLGWVAVRAWKRPTAIVPAGVGAWLATVVGGMVLRVLVGQGTAAPFIIVALVFLGVTMLGWRVVARLIAAAGGSSARVA